MLGVRLIPCFGLVLAVSAAMAAPVDPAPIESSARLSGRVLDTAGNAVAGAALTLRAAGEGVLRSAAGDAHGQYAFEDVAPGPYTLEVLAPGFSIVQVVLTVGATGEFVKDFALERGPFTETVTVIASHLGGRRETLDRVPGSIESVDATELSRSQPFEFSEALRKVAGVHVRDEEGFGLRPNIGLRGLNPTRSSKVLLLEDGLFVTYAPYGDNASYYHPPIERFESIEVLKGSGQIAYGPTTVGGVVNYITPSPPIEPAGHATLTAGSRDFLDAKVTWGGTFGTTGLLVDALNKSGDGARENVHSEITDLTVKLVQPLGPRHLLTFKANHYGEESDVTYSGLREVEFRENPRQNAFDNDAFDGSRTGFSASHSWSLRSDALWTTQLYGMDFTRDWWRQSSNSNQRPNDASDPNCGGMANLETTCGNEGRLRDYTHGGIESRFRFGHGWFGAKSEAEVGARLHFERQDRIQQNGDRPTARSGVTVEDNVRKNQAYSLFFENRVLFGDWTVTPGLRIERVDYERTNRLANDGLGVQGETDLTQWVPGLGVSWRAGDRATLFGGVHRGWAPPRTEDVVNASGGVVELDPELSWNYEFGVRSEPTRGVQLDGTWFRMDYENQVVPSSVAGGEGATLTNGGATLHQGFEFAARLDVDEVIPMPLNLNARVAYTYLPTAEYRGERFSTLPGNAGVRVTGNRLPYAPEHLLTASWGFDGRSGIGLFLEAVRVGEQYADDLSTLESSADGQRGRIPGYTIWNATASYRADAIRSEFFVTVKNLADRLYIADRTRGIVPGSPRLLQVGIRVRI